MKTTVTDEAFVRHDNESELAHEIRKREIMERMEEALLAIKHAVGGESDDPDRDIARMQDIAREALNPSSPVSTHPACGKNPILIGIAEVLDEEQSEQQIPEEIQQITKNQGFYIGCDPDHPLKGEAPLVSIDGQIWSMVLDKPLDPTRFLPNTKFVGPFRAKFNDTKNEAYPD